MVMTNERGQNTHSKGGMGENSVIKESVSNIGTD